MKYVSYTNPCDDCALRFNCPNDDPEPEYCPWFI